MIARANNAYGQTRKSTLNGRALEAEAFVKSARKLHEAACGNIDATIYEQALKRNWKLWTLLQASMSKGEGALPEDLRQDILGLSIFVDKQTLKALADPSLKNVESLININRNMAGGLFQ